MIVIQARTGSTRLPGKVLARLAGATLLERMVERVLAANVDAKVVVATSVLAEDDAIRQICKRRSFRCFSGDPYDLLARHVGAARSVGADVLVKIPSDCPLIDPAVVERVLGFASSNREHFDFVTNLLPPSFPDGQDVEVMATSLAERALVEARERFEREHTTPFFWLRPERFRLGNVSWREGRDLSARHRWTVDYPEDLTLVRCVYDALWSANQPAFGVESILDFLEDNPEVDELNARWRGTAWWRQLPTSRRPDRGPSKHERVMIHRSWGSPA